ncbi:MAG: YbdK family carboxylate-amine ligase [Solirubrobacterales bacterium]
MSISTESEDVMTADTGETASAVSLPGWSQWHGGDHPAWTIGIEEEVMLLNTQDLTLAQSIDYVLRTVSPDLAERLTAETHGSAVELATGINSLVSDAITDLKDVRTRLKRELEPLALKVACSGTHPQAVWYQTVISSGERYQSLYGSMRELARREPTFALHVHVGVADPEDGIRLYNRMRAHVPLLLALSANSPYWQGRDTGLASARTPLFQAFPRVGIPLKFGDYSEYVETVDLLIRSGCFPEPTYLWWDVRPQPRFGTIEIRTMDAQIESESTAALVALVQSVAKLEVEEGYVSERQIVVQEALNENRFLGARDGYDAELIDADTSTRVPISEQLPKLINAARPHAQDLGCEAELDLLVDPNFRTGAQSQREQVRAGASLTELVGAMAQRFA